MPKNRARSRAHGSVRIWLITSVTVVLLATTVWSNRESLALYAVSKYMDSQIDVGPFREISWREISGSADQSSASGIASADKSAPNIVLIMADDLGWNDISLNGGGIGGGLVKTPNIDSIGQDGAVFSNGYAANGTCAPSRAALMSGRYGTRFGFEFTPTPPGMMSLTKLPLAGSERLRLPIGHEAEGLEYEEMGMPGSERTIAELVADQGYHTMHIGKWHLGLSNGMDPRSQGFVDSLLMASGLYLPEDHPDVVNSKQNFDPIDRFLWASMRYAVAFNGEVFAPNEYQTDYFSKQAVRAIEANKDRPFFLYLAFWAPHTPLQAAKEDYDALGAIELHRERVYGAMVRSLDRGVGRVLDALERNGLDDNTLVLFTSDNGGAGYIGLPEVNDPYRGWKITLFEGGIHVPFLARWPKQIPAGTVFDEPVQHFDMYATAAAAAGAPMPTDRIMDGVDLLPHLKGLENAPPHEELFWRSGASQSALVNGWKLNVSDPPGRRWLFNLAVDPTEQNDLSKQEPQKLAELEAALARHNAAQAEPAWGSQASFPINIDKDLTQADEEDDEYIYWSN
ncbi:MAG: sulfatase-like hydrolase/transferase [Pseudomonadota bacterium]